MELVASIPLLLSSLAILLYVLYKFVPPIWILPIMNSFGLLYCILQIYWLSNGYQGIVYILISWLFIMGIGFSVMSVGIHFLKKHKSIR